MPLSASKFESSTFPGLVEGAGPPLPEDFAMRGLLWSGKYHPPRWMAEAKVDDDDRGFELASMAEQRRERILWLGCRLAEHERWILYGGEDHAFSVAPEFAEEADSGMSEGGEEGTGVEGEGSEGTVGA